MEAEGDKGMYNRSVYDEGVFDKRNCMDLINMDLCNVALGVRISGDDDEGRGMVQLRAGSGAWSMWACTTRPGVQHQRVQRRHVQR